MKIFQQINKYNSLNIFNLIISSFIIILIFCYFAEISFTYSAIPIRIIYICLKILPFVLVICGLLIAKFFFFDKKNKTTKDVLIPKIMTIINIIFYFLLIGIYFLFLLYEADKHIIKSPNNYAKGMKIIKQQEKISHFPKTIPANADKIQMYCYTSDYNGEVFILKFNINKEYIEQELKNHKFLNSDTPIGTPQEIYYVYNDNNRIKTDNTTWYVIDNEENKQIYKKYFPYYSSIGISNNLDFIIYYYIEPSD